MKVFVQKVQAAKVTVGEEEVTSIENGLCIFVGFSKNDTGKDVDYMVRKVLALELFENDNGMRWQKSVRETNNDILCVSQFSLYNRLKGNTPDFHQAMQGEDAQRLYNSFLNNLASNYSEEKIKDGRFGVKRIVHILCKEPVALTLESPITFQNEDTSCD